MRKRPSHLDTRSPEQIHEHYEIERELAGRLRGAAKAERRLLYRTLYDELFRRVPHHPQLTQKSSPAATAREVRRQLGLLNRFLAPSTRFLEVGPGDCALSFAVAERVKWVYGVDVSDTITRHAIAPSNFALLTTDGSSIDLAPDTVDVAYSNQLMEHLHPEDALDQLRNIFRVLVPGGRYVVVTPNRLSGPWDVTRYFDRVACGFHLKEYTVGDLRGLLQAAGFRQVDAYVGARGLFMRVPTGLICGLERVLAALPDRIGWTVAHTTPVRILLGMRIVAVK